MFAWIWPKLDPEGRIGATPMRQDSPPSLPAALLLLLMGGSGVAQLWRRTHGGGSLPCSVCRARALYRQSWKIQRVAPSTTGS
jgi:hypothetical protein